MITIGGCSARIVPISGIVTWKSASTSSRIGLERLVGAVELVDQQHRRPALVRLQRLQQRPLDQETLGEDVLREARRDRCCPAASARRISIIWRA